MSDKSNKVYLIERAFPEDDRDVTRLLIRYNPTQGVSMFDVFRGMPLTRKYFQNFDVKVDMQGDLYDCLPGNLSWLFVSPRTIQLLEKLGATGWKTYDLKLGELNSTLKDYKLLYSEVCLNQLNLEESHVDWNDDKSLVVDLRKIVLLREFMIPVDIFAVKGMPYFLFASQRVGDALIAAKISGLGFTEIEVMG